jgi:excisionase family DNA binding protein
MSFSPNLVLGIADLLAAIPVCRTTIYNAINAGHLKVTKIGRRTLFREQDVEAWLALGRPSGAPGSTAKPTAAGSPDTRRCSLAPLCSRRRPS